MKTLFLGLLCLFQLTAFAGNTGLLKGTVTDKATKEALVNAGVIINGTKTGTVTDKNGAYCLKDITEGKYNISFSCVGYHKVTKKGIVILKDKATVLDVELEPREELQQACVKVDALSSKDINRNHKPGSGKNISKFKAIKMGSIATLESGVISASTPDWNTEEYSKINENSFQDVIKRPLSTFAADIDAGSYSNVRRFLLENQLPYKDAVRVEEFINYFDYKYKNPGTDKPFSVNFEFADCPWNSSHKLISIGLQGRSIPKAEQQPSSLVFLLDVSGSMEDPNKLPLLKKAFKLLVDNLSPKDKVAIVVYASNTAVILPEADGDEKQKIYKAIDNLRAGGSTAGGAGIELAYETAKKNFIKGGNNRVILATDGDFNVGISSTSELVRYIEDKRKDGIFLTILGFGMGNYKDGRLEELADKGNGNHFYIDNLLEAKKVFVDQLTSTLFTIAKDVKIQVEFNPAKIKNYRLLGYENRKLEDKDFTDDTKDAGEVGSGHRVTVLYEVELADNSAGGTDELKYQSTTVKKSAYSSDEYLTLRIRYKQPDGDKSAEMSEVLDTKPCLFNKAGSNLVFAAAVAEFAMLLRDSEYKGTSSYGSVINMAKSAKGADENGYRAEFISLVERAELLSKK